MWREWRTTVSQRSPEIIVHRECAAEEGRRNDGRKVWAQLPRPNFWKNRCSLKRWLRRILCIDKFVWKISWLLIMKIINESIYWHGTGSISNCLNRHATWGSGSCTTTHIVWSKEDLVHVGVFVNYMWKCILDTCACVGVNVKLFSNERIWVLWRLYLFLQTVLLLPFFFLNAKRWNTDGCFEI